MCEEGEVTKEEVCEEEATMKEQVTCTDESVFNLQRKGKGHFSLFTLVVGCPSKNIGCPKQLP